MSKSQIISNPKSQIEDDTGLSKADLPEERLIDFAVRIIKLAANLPKTAAGKHVAGQILRSGTSPAPNYGERGAEREQLRFYS
jgi:hypothetical protein